MKASGVIVAFMVVALTGSQVAGLSCYQCGSYSMTGSGSVSPCHSFDQSNLKQCSPADTHCVKYVNEGIIVRQCVPECKAGVKDMTELHCCQEDGCNGASVTTPRIMILVSTFMVFVATHIMRQ